MARRPNGSDPTYTRTGKVRGREAEGIFAVIVRAADRSRIARLRPDGTADVSTEESVPTSELIEVKPTYRVPVGQRGTVTLPGDLRRDSSFRQGSMLQIVQEADGRLTVTALPDSLPRVDLAELLSRVTPENIHAETDWGGPVGQETW